MHFEYKILTLISRWIICLFLAATLLNPLIVYFRGVSVTAPSAKPQANMQILLIPLDSRPPCRDFPGQLAAIANIKVIIPPPGYLDHYNQPGDVKALANWLSVVGPSADAVVVSIDQLMHGGLLASRLPAGKRSDAEQVLSLLTRFHQENPHIPLYAFNIIPRLLLADTAENQPYKPAMATYSALTDRLSLADNSNDRAQLTQLENIIPLDIRTRYRDMYATNLWLGQQLIALAETGVLQHVVLGQDDASPYGMANMNKRGLQAWAKDLPAQDRFSITRGTDEIAATLLAKLAAEQSGFKPRIYVKYSWPGASRIIMPYMPSSVEETVNEKIALVNGSQVQSPAEADFILYLHIGTPQTPPAVMQHAAREIAQYLQAGQAVSLVDLSQLYDKEKNLFPFLAKSHIPLSRLVSYNGWNTTSNSVGTAVAHAVLYTYGRQTGRLQEEKHYAYLFQRFLDDWYYQKDVQPELNYYLTKKNIAPADLRDHYTMVNLFVQKKLSFAADSFYARYFRGKLDGNRRISYLGYKIQLPWPRTFEVQLDVSDTITPPVPAKGGRQDL